MCAFGTPERRIVRYETDKSVTGGATIMVDNYGTCWQFTTSTMDYCATGIEVAKLTPDGRILSGCQ